MKNLLIGNGINNRIGVNGLDIVNVRNRFINVAIRYTPLINALFDDDYEKTIKECCSRFKEKGIEHLASDLYSAIKDKKISWSDNDQLRLEDTLKCMALTAIFYTENGQIERTYCKEKLPDIAEYGEIFTLNYYEFWDEDDVCNYLHGKFNLDTMPDEKNMLITSICRMNNEAYKATLNKLITKEYIYAINRPSIIFSPDIIPKSELVEVLPSYPSEDLFPADDIFCREAFPLYKSLDEIEELDVFGVSPNGDDSLLSILKRIKIINVYVHNKDTNYESNIWQRKLNGTNYRILDAEDMK